MHIHRWLYRAKNVRICVVCKKRQERDYGDGLWTAWLKKWRDV